MQTEILHELFSQFKNNPEKSNNEYKTQQLINNFFTKHLPEYIVQPLADTGLACIPKNSVDKKLLLIRADMDAVICETVDASGKISYKVAHLCGHHGHMTIAIGLAIQLKNFEHKDYTIGFVFQPAEETGEGALKIINDRCFRQHQIDGIIGFHNLPGFTEHSIVIKNNVFAAASCGVVIRLNGVAAHAAEPENSVNPASAIAQIINFFNTLCSNNGHFRDFTQITITYIHSGNPNFGLSPAGAEFFATLRSFCDDDMKKMKQRIAHKIEEIAAFNNLHFFIEFKEEFPTTINNADDWMLQLKIEAQHLGFTVIEKPQPFRWSEDFGHYLKWYKGFYFGFGIGEQAFPLHHSNYEFPYKAIPKMINLLCDTIKRL